jgi:hypothetical protein
MAKEERDLFNRLRPWVAPRFAGRMAGVGANGENR